MKLHLQRIHKTADCTIGLLTADGTPVCHILEDTDRGLRQGYPVDVIRKMKIHGQTAIPTGTYTVRFTRSPRFKREMLQIMDVPGYEGVRIHAGNTSRDTEGCLLPGDRDGDKPRVINSRSRVAQLERMVRDAGGTAELVIES